jgi:hypothetical protein
MTDNLAHHSLGASGAHRWMNCPGSVRLCAMAPPSEDTEFSREGTRAHEHAALIYSGNAKGVVQESDWPADDWAAIYSYVDYCRALPGQKHIETRLSLDPYIPGGFSTVDFAAMHENTLTIVDLKFGKGYEVYAERNPQLMIYALGALLEFGFLYDIHVIRMVIHQPRRNHVDEWDISVAELMAWADGKLKLAVHDAMRENSPIVPGPTQCKFCPVKATCPALAEKVIAEVTRGFDVDGLTLSDMLGWVDTARSWASAIEARAMEELISGKDVPGWKIVDGRSTRSWADEKDVLAELTGYLGDKAFTQKLVSPAQAEKLLGKKSDEWQKIAETHIQWSTPKPTLARESSAKQAIITNATEGFEA